MFGTVEKEIGKDFLYGDEDNKPKTYEAMSVYENHPLHNRGWKRFKMKPNEEDAFIVFLDDTIGFTSEQQRLLSMLGFTQELAVFEHTIKTQEGWRQYTCPSKGLTISPRLRLYYYLQTKAWAPIGKKLSEVSGKERSEIIAGLFTDKYVNQELFNEIVENENMRFYMQDVIHLPLGASIPGCPICGTGKFKPSLRRFRTIMDLREITAKDGTVYKDQLQLHVMSNVADKKFRADQDPTKRGRVWAQYPKTIAGFEMLVQRIPDMKPDGKGGMSDMSAGAGSSFTLQAPADFEDLKDRNAFVTFELTQTSLEERLADNNGFYALVYELETGNEPDVDTIMSVFTDDLSEVVQIPGVPDYYTLLLPKTPSYINKFVFGKGGDDRGSNSRKSSSNSEYGPSKNTQDFSEDDIPF